MEKIIRPDLKKKYYFSRRKQSWGVATQGVVDSVGSDEFISGCGAVGSVLRSGRRGRKFESSHPDKGLKNAVVNQ